MDDREFEDAYRRHAGAVLRFAIRATGRLDLAEDVTSEAFVALYRNRAGIDAAQLPSWLFTVVRHRATDVWRHLRVEDRFIEQEKTRPEPSVSPAAGSEKSLVEILDDVPQLKAVHRACLVLRYVHDFTRDEIARHTGMTATQVKGLLQYALALVRRRLEERSQ